jgi:micrococcal nuclease
MFGLLALASLAVADRAGWFGRGGDDLTRYDNQHAKVVHHVDGDTFDVDIPDTRQGRPTTRLRLWGVDTPETVKPNAAVDYFGPEASAFTKKMTLGQTVHLHVLHRRSRDKYDRLLAYVDLSDGRMLNRLLVEEGYAYADPRFSHPYQQEFAGLMREARRDHRGLWAQVQESQLPAYLRQRMKP